MDTPTTNSGAPAGVIIDNTDITCTPPWSSTVATVTMQRSGLSAAHGGRTRRKPDGEEAAVTGGDARHGRRDNGLTAAQYAAAGDVDPRVGEHLLDVLAVDGIAAYLRPSADVNPLTRSNHLPDRPTDRLYVDRAHLATARGYLAKLAGDPVVETPPARIPGPDDDLWAQIVAAYDDEPGERSWPAAEDIAGTDEPRRTAEPRRDATGTENPHRRADPTASTHAPTLDQDPTAEPPAPLNTSNPTIDEPHRGRSVIRGWPQSGAPPPEPPARPVDHWGAGTRDADGPSLLDGLDTFGADLADDEGYVPPAPPPIPRPSLPTTLGVIGIVGGLIIFLRPEVMPLAASVAMMLGFTAVLAGFATLVWRLRPGDDDDEDIDPDDGARV